MKTIDVTGIGNALLDIFLEIGEQDFAVLGYERATMRLVDSADQRQLLARFRDNAPMMASGGSVANSIIALSQLGGRGAFIGSFGDDDQGRYYKREFDSLGIALNAGALSTELTGTCIALITPDAERTMRTSLGAAALLTPAHVDEGLIRHSRWLFVEGYLLANPEFGHPSVRAALALASRHQTRVALTLSEAWVVQGFRAMVDEVVESAALVFANEAEAREWAGTPDVESAFRALCSRVPNVVVTRGPLGALVQWEGREYRVPAFPCEPKDLTGAGDMFAGAFLYGANHGVAPDAAARGACFLAMHVISRVGARLHTGTRSLWEECLRAAG